MVLPCEGNLGCGSALRYGCAENVWGVCRYDERESGIQRIQTSLYMPVKPRMCCRMESAAAPARPTQCLLCIFASAGLEWSLSFGDDTWSAWPAVVQYFEGPLEIGGKTVLAQWENHFSQCDSAVKHITVFPAITAIASLEYNTDWSVVGR